MKFFPHAGHEWLACVLEMKTMMCSAAIVKRGISFIIFLGMFIPIALAADPVTGRVVDDKGNPLPGVTVAVKGKDGGVTTDVTGKYTIEIPDDTATLVFTFVGFSPFEVKVSGRKSIDVTMQPESKSLGEVVVVGYGRQRKVNLVGAVSQVSVDDKIASRALPNISSGLEGLVPGLAVTQNSGMAGRNNASLLIRGLGTVNNANP